MKNGIATRVGAGAALSALLAVALGCGAPPTTAQAPGPSPAAKAAAVDTVRGTVRLVSAEGGYCDVIAGVGYAIKMMRLQAVPGPTIEALQPGDYVRAVYKKEGDRFVATRIEKIARTP